MNPGIADLASKYADRPAEDRDWAGYAVADADGTYRYFTLTISRIEWWLAMEIERQAESASQQGWWYDDDWNRVAA